MANQPKNPSENDKTTETTEVGPRRPLLRSRKNRVLWGVAGGLAEHLGFNATLVRIAFVVLCLFGGAGILAYLVLAVALREDDGSGNPVDESVWSRLGKVALVCLLVAIGLCAAVCLAAVSAWATATGHGTVVAGVVIAVGASPPPCSHWHWCWVFPPAPSRPPTSTSTRRSGSGPTRRPSSPTSPPTATSSAPASWWWICAGCRGRRARLFRSRRT